MSEFKRTPGPWMADDYGVTGSGPVGPDNVVLLWRAPEGRDIKAGDVRLIEAAPDLLEACQIARLMADRRDWTTNHQVAYERLLDVLGKPEHYSHRNVDDLVMRFITRAIHQATGRLPD